MVLDEPRDTDDVFHVNGFTLVIDQGLHEQTRDVTVDYKTHYLGSSFEVTSEIPVGGGACAPSCSC